MRALFLLTLCLCGFLITSAQDNPDSLGMNIHLVQQARSESVRNSLAQLPDSLSSTCQKMDSIRHEFNMSVDSLKNQYTIALQKIDGQKNWINSSIDSLQRLNLPTTEFTELLDSLSHLRLRTEAKFITRLNSIKSKTTDKLQSLDLPAEYQQPLLKLTQKVNDLHLGADVIAIPALDVFGYSVPGVNHLGNIPSKVPEMANVDKIADLPEIQTRASQLSEIGGQAKAYQNDIKAITEGNLDQVEKLPEALEQQASRIDGIEELQKQSGLMDEHKAALDELKDSAKAKQKAASMVKKVAVDHFAGKQEQLKAAMDKISKYKQKYSSVSSIKDLPKRPPNLMKGKPFVERLVPGLYFQYQHKNVYLVDINPYLGYRITGRLAAGLGWNQRYGYDKDARGFITRSAIFGPRTYVDFKLARGFIAHLEAESMNTFVPSTLHTTPDVGYREWVWSFMTGLKKEYRIYKNLKGTALIQYNLFNRYYKAPYVDRLNSRIGFEYVLKNKMKKGKD